MNPALTLGPDIVSLNITGWWIYAIGPVAGAFIAVLINGLVPGVPDKEERGAAEGDAMRTLHTH
jgi:Major intrinsic protein